MDVIKVFTEEPVGLEALVPDEEPDARRRSVAPAGSLEAFLARAPEPYARAYLAGTHLGPERRVGLTAVDAADAWLAPVLNWAAARAWHLCDADGAVQKMSEAEAAAALRDPEGVAALALGPAPSEALAAAVGERRSQLPALRAVLDAGAAVFFPEPAFDGKDWSLFSTAPLRAGLAEAFRQRPAPGVRRLFAPYRRARGEHTFYLEQWALDDLPDWAEEV